MTGIAVEPRYAEAFSAVAVKFTVSGRGDMPADYHVTLEIGGKRVLDEWLLGPAAFKYSVVHTFDVAGARPIVATLTELPAGTVWQMLGEITVVPLPLLFSVLPLAVGAGLLIVGRV